MKDCLAQIKLFILDLNNTMDVLNPRTYDAEEDQLRERTKYTEMDKHLLPMEFQQAPVSTGVRYSLLRFFKIFILLYEF